MRHLRRMRRRSPLLRSSTATWQDRRIKAIAQVEKRLLISSRHKGYTIRAMLIQTGCSTTRLTVRRRTQTNWQKRRQYATLKIRSLLLALWAPRICLTLKRSTTACLRHRRTPTERMRISKAEIKYPTNSTRRHRRIRENKTRWPRNSTMRRLHINRVEIPYLTSSISRISHISNSRRRSTRRTGRQRWATSQSWRLSA